jgi:hypothetical protein
MTRQHGFGWWLVVLLLLLPVFSASAQDGGPQLTVVDEFDLGDACVVTGVFSADGQTLWTLVTDCNGNYAASLQPISVTEGTAVGQFSTPAVFDIGGQELISSNRPFVLQADGMLTADFIDWETGATTSFVVDTASGIVTPVPESPRFLTTEAIDAALPDFTGYTDFLMYSVDRALTVLQDDTTFYVMDVAGGAELMRVSPPEGIEYAFAEISPLGHLFIWLPAEPGNYDNPASTLVIYDIPSGDELARHEIPNMVYSVSPDERFLVLNTAATGGQHESLALFELATGALSDSLPTRSTTVNLNICKNDGRTTEFGWTSDDPLLVDIVWLPDSSGFVTLQSETFSSGPNPCLTNDSRMRVYAVTAAS